MTRAYWALAFLLVVATCVGTVLVSPGLPATIPTHWDIHGKVDGHGPKDVNLILLPCTMIGLLGLFRLLPVLSPKQFEVDAFRTTYLYLMVLILGFFGYMQGLLLYAAATGHVGIVRALVGGAFLLFALLGNVLGRVRRNFFIGVRVPWTLASERVWNDTHRVAAWLFTLCGLVGFVIVVTGLPIVAALSALAVALVVPIVYSFVHYKRLERRGLI